LLWRQVSLMSLTNPNQIQRAELHLAVQVLQKPELVNYNQYYKKDRLFLIVLNILSQLRNHN
jgi:hypothetical protein